MAFDMTKFSLEMITVVLLSVCCGTSDGLIGPNGMVLSDCDPYFMSWNLLEPRPFYSHGDPNTHRATRPKQGPRTPLNPCLVQFNTAPPEGTRNSLVTRTSGDEEGAASLSLQGRGTAENTQVPELGVTSSHELFLSLRHSYCYRRSV